MQGNTGQIPAARSEAAPRRGNLELTAVASDAPIPARSILISIAPILHALTELEDDIARIRRRIPNSAEIGTLEAVHTSLSVALTEARRENTWLDVSDVFTTTGIPESTIRRRCRQYRNACGAEKQFGDWKIHWPTWQDFAATHSRSGADL
jgi:hypothetical protein